MTSRLRPDFLDSPYFVADPGNWHLKPGAPKKVVKEFKAFMKDTELPPPVTAEEIEAMLIKERRKRA